VANPIITSIGDGSLGSPHYVDWEGMFVAVLEGALDFKVPSRS